VGIFIKSPDPISMGENVTVEFLLPGTLNSIRVPGEAAWARAHEEGEGEDENCHMVGIEFTDLEEPYRGLVLDYTLKMLNNEDLLRDGGILLVLDDLRNLPAAERLKAYNILIKKGSGPVL
jgi:hypothetical protein